MSETVVLVGGAGLVGRLIGPAVAASRQVILADRVQMDAPEWAAAARLVDVASLASLRAALQGADAMVYLAMGTKEDWGSETWASSQFDVNVRGLFTALEACALEGITRVVIAGSMSVFQDFFAAPTGTMPDATDAYGLSKRLGEQVAESAARLHGIDVTVLRLTFPADATMWEEAGRDPHATIMTSADDTARAFVAALDRDGESGFRALPITGDHASEYIDWEPTRVALGWQPLSRR